MSEVGKEELTSIEGRLLGLDYGEKNIGVAVSDELQQITTPLTVIRRAKNGAEYSEIATLAREWDAAAVICGLPSLEKKPVIDKLVSRLRHECRLPVFLVDETLSTKESNRGLPPTVKRRQGDAYAAEHILRSALNQLE